MGFAALICHHKWNVGSPLYSWDERTLKVADYIGEYNLKKVITAVLWIAHGISGIDLTP